MEENKICKICGKVVDISKNGFVVGKTPDEENFMHLSCYRKNEAKEMKDTVMEEIQDI